MFQPVQESPWETVCNPESELLHTGGRPWPRGTPSRQPAPRLRVGKWVRGCMNRVVLAWTVSGRHSFLPRRPWGLYHQSRGHQQLGQDGGGGDSAGGKERWGPHVAGCSPRTLPHSGTGKLRLGRSCSHHTWHRCLDYTLPGVKHRGQVTRNKTHAGKCWRKSTRPSVLGGISGERVLRGMCANECRGEPNSPVGYTGVEAALPTPSPTPDRD